MQQLRHLQTHRGRANCVLAPALHWGMFLMYVQTLEDRTYMAHSKAVLLSHFHQDIDLPASFVVIDQSEYCH